MKTKLFISLIFIIFFVACKNGSEEKSPTPQIYQNVIVTQLIDSGNHISNNDTVFTSGNTDGSDTVWVENESEREAFLYSTHIVRKPKVKYVTSRPAAYISDKFIESCDCPAGKIKETKFEKVE